MEPVFNPPFYNKFPAIMKKIMCVLALFVFSIHTSAQDDIEKQRKAVVEEAKRLYTSEMASWYGASVLLDNITDRLRIGGYFSYEENGEGKCIFLSNDDQPTVIGSITFDSTFNLKTAVTDSFERKLTTREMDIYIMRKKVFEELNKDSVFKEDESIHTSLVPFINENEKKIYALTGSQKTDVIIFGDDYLVTFDEKNNVVGKKKLHKNSISMSYKERSDSTDEIVTMHSHLEETEEFITVTDVCTLLLHEKFTNWNGHNVIGKDHIFVWNCEKDELMIIPRNGGTTLKGKEKGKKK
jgi:hypothetical protein